MTDEKPQQMLRMTENQCNYVALAQRMHGPLMAEAQALVSQGQAKAAEAQAELRRAVEGAFKEQGQPFPAGEIKIVNDEHARPAVLVWVEPEQAPEEPDEEQKPVAPVALAVPVNGRTVPEVVRRKLATK